MRALSVGIKLDGVCRHVPEDVAGDLAVSKALRINGVILIAVREAAALVKTVPANDWLDRYAIRVASEDHAAPAVPRVRDVAVLHDRVTGVDLHSVRAACTHDAQSRQRYVVRVVGH